MLWILNRPNIKSLIPREKFLDNKNNKAQFILLLSEIFFKNGISVEQYHGDHADIDIIRAALDEAKGSTVEMRAHGMDIMVLLIHHASDHPILLTTARETS